MSFYDGMINLCFFRKNFKNHGVIEIGEYITGMVALKCGGLYCFGLQDRKMRTFHYHIDFTDFMVSRSFLNNLKENTVLAF